MSNYRDPISQVSRDSLDIDFGLRQYMIKVYNYMAVGLGLTGLVAFLVSNSPSLMQAIFASPLQWVVMFAPLVLVFFIAARINSLSFSTAQTLFWIYAATVGVSISFIFLVYTGESIARMFFITSSIFATMSIYGYTTKKDLTSMGSFLIMGVLGIFVASIVNIFLKSTGLQKLLSVLTVIVFTGLTAYDVQKIKEFYYEADDEETIGKKALFGALSLYLDFLNLFLALLRLFGDRR